MTPAQILALLRDVAIVGALVWLVWRIYNAGEQAVKTQDLKAVQTQLETNLKTQAQWAQDARNADIRRQQDMSTVSAAIAAHREPIVILRDPPGARSLPGAAPGPEGQSSRTGGSDPGPRGDSVDVREAISAFELQYEKPLADCRAALAQWPR